MSASQRECFTARERICVCHRQGLFHGDVNAGSASHRPHHLRKISSYTDPTVRSELRDAAEIAPAPSVVTLTAAHISCSCIASRVCTLTFAKPWARGTASGHSCRMARIARSTSQPRTSSASCNRLILQQTFFCVNLSLQQRGRLLAGTPRQPAGLQSTSVAMFDQVSSLCACLSL